MLRLTGGKRGAAMVLAGFAVAIVLRGCSLPAVAGKTGSAKSSQASVTNGLPARPVATPTVNDKSDPVGSLSAGDRLGASTVRYEGYFSAGRSGSRFEQ
ncbi:MAG: hypothetical protein HQ546_09725 [Planctomycetes bacterium]|nr:hypothetical protein [Planctomycetota bacterium]